MGEHHPQGPSRLPMLAKCTCFRAKEEVSEEAKNGTLQHRLLSWWLKTNIFDSDPNFAAALSPDDIGNVEFAYARVTELTSPNRLSEERLVLVGDDFSEITFGTADILDCVGSRALLADYKSGDEKDYTAQLACYARMAMQRYGVSICDVYSIYGRLKKVVPLCFTWGETDFVLDIIRRAQHIGRQPCANEHCGWCADETVCPAVTDQVVQVVTEYETDTLPALTEFHASEISDPKMMATALQIAGVAESWAKSVKYHAKQLAMNGAEIPGYELKDGKNNRSLPDIMTAWKASGLSAEEFLSCCSVSVSNIEKILAGKLGYKTVGKKVKNEFNARFGALVEAKQCAPELRKKGK